MFIDVSSIVWSHTQFALKSGPHFEAKLKRPSCHSTSLHLMELRAEQIYLACVYGVSFKAVATGAGPN